VYERNFTQKIHVVSYPTVIGNFHEDNGEWNRWGLARGKFLINMEERDGEIENQ